MRLLHHQRGQKAACRDQCRDPLVLRHQCRHSSSSNCHTRSWRAQSIQYGAKFTAAGLSIFLPPYLNSAIFSFSVIFQQKVFVWFDHYYKLKKDMNAIVLRQNEPTRNTKNSKCRVNSQMKFHFHKIARHRGLLERF